ncbi:conserved hypothetical protein [Desulfosarcina cetonica]|uniref:hypothetical protein n=1 Tax=Desulfosarcina cetonica TaxID=90730 RepID=UPI0012ED5E70|nr:hypothetical protein [Desulfosarcina cetonica]VTR68122.1 conserved hypothetical protein [Desulfosarcina cetonica]
MTDLKRTVTTYAVFVLVVILFTACATPATERPAARTDRFSDLPALLSPPADAPDYKALTDYKDDYEASAHSASIDYLNANPKLVQRIQNDLGCKEIQWRLSGISHRVLYAPERRKKVAGLFTDYCQEAITDTLHRTGLANPYHSISAPDQVAPCDSTDPGVNAIIVRDLAREYEAHYRFSGATQKTIDVDLSGRIPLNEVGSYVSYLEYSPAEHRWRFTHDHQTVWKCTAQNPYTVLMTPLEETLHISLRKYTERAILASLDAEKAPASAETVQATVDDWLAVEEAVVGGLVYKLAPDVVLKRVPGLSPDLIQADIATKTQFKKYRMLRNGIDWVEKHGLKESIHRYQQDPAAVRDRLITDSPHCTTDSHPPGKGA